MHRVEPDHDVAQGGTEGRSIAATDSHDCPGVNRLAHLRVRRDLLERLIQCGIGRGQDEDPQPLRQQFADDVGEGRRFAGAGWSPHERQIAVRAELDSGTLAGVQRRVRPDQCPGLERRVELAEQRHRPLDSKAVRVDLLERLEKSFVEKPGIDDQDGVPVLECDGALAPQRHFGTVDAIDPDQVFRVGRTQGAFEARHELLVERQRSECVGRTALRLVEHVALAIGQDDLERASALAHGLHLLSDGPCEMRDETGQQARKKRGACPILHGSHRREVIVADIDRVLPIDTDDRERAGAGCGQSGSAHAWLRRRSTGLKR